MTKLTVFVHGSQSDLYQNITCVMFYLKPPLTVFRMKTRHPAVTSWPCIIWTTLPMFSLPSGLPPHCPSIRSMAPSAQGLCTSNLFFLGPYFPRSVKVRPPHLSGQSLNFTSSEGISLSIYLSRVILEQYPCLCPP